MSGRCVNLVALGVFAVVVANVPFAPAAGAAVRVWEEDVVIPTYVVGPPDPNPIFFSGRASQGAEQRVYPYPMYDNLTGEKEDKTYRMVYMENEYIRIGILPEIGGRIFEAVDKTNGYNFFYRQHVIKPALISLLGAWISGGVEWNIPHHHRATSFLPVQYRIEENADGSKTVWVGELELRHRMRWAVGCTVRPGTSLLEVSFRILNRTPTVNTILCFANPAVSVNENYQVIFPPSTQYVTHHAKREFTTWPIATTRYGGGDFTSSVDVSWYKNHFSSNSMFAWNYEDEFFAGYDHGKEAGTMSVANHYIVPGKKLWTWGNGPRGRAQDTILTDSDGPYMELMVGAYSDNQPDYSWIQPYEVKSFKEYWYPFRDIGGVKKANTEAAVNLDVNNTTAKVGFYTTSAHAAAVATLTLRDKVLLREKTAVHPGRPYVKEVVLPADANQYDLRTSISAGGKELVAYSPIRLTPEPMPSPVEAPPPPEQIKTNEELYLTGLRIEQFYNPSLEPDPYWEEALRRDPCDVRVNTALGINYIKKAKFADAEKLLRTALARLTANYTTPKDGEPYYYLGVALRAQGKSDEAFAVFYKATWSAAWRAAAYYNLAEIACSRGDAADAMDLVDRSLEANALNIRALDLKAALLRHAGHPKEAMAVLASARTVADPLDVRIMAEQWLATKSNKGRKSLVATMNQFPATGLETAAEYMNAGLWQDGTAVLGQVIEAAPDRNKVSPLVYYYLGYFAEKLGQKKKALEYYQLAVKMPTDYVFPFQYENIEVLQRAMAANPSDSHAPYYLGNLLFDGQSGAAVEEWEKSSALGATFPIVYRNLAMVYTREGNARDKAIASLEKAVVFGGSGMHLFELDQLYEEAGTSPAKRLEMLETHHKAVLERDDALSREVSLKVFAGKYDEAIELLKGRRFAVWEGGARFNVSDSWTDAHLLRGHQRFAAKQYKEALADYQAAIEFPQNLQEANTEGSRRYPEAAYWMGLAYEALGDKEKATELWKESAAGASGPARAAAAPTADAGGRAGVRGARGGGRGMMRGGGRGFRGMMGAANSTSYYQALSLQKLGDSAKAEAMFQEMVKSGTEGLQGTPQVDFFANFGGQQSQRARTANAHYTAGLGYLGLSDKGKAKEEFTQVLAAKPDHLGAKTMLMECNK